MFASAELGSTIDDDTYKKKARELRTKLLDAQYELLEDKTFPVIVLVSGVDGAGKGETVNLLNEWLDPRHVRSSAFDKPTPDEAARPPMWRYWKALPPKGQIGVLFGSWYTHPIVDRVSRATSEADLTAALDRIRRMEKLLTDDGGVIVKLWFHLSKKAQGKRLRSLEKDKLTRWRVNEQDWANFKRYDRFAAVSERVLRETSTGEAPWVVIEGADANYRSITAGRALLSAIEERLKAANSEKKGGAKPNGAAVGAGTLVECVDTAGILRDLPFKERLSKQKYATEVVKAQGALNKLSRAPAMKAHSVVVVFEGMDAAGKGGAIRRVTQALDARHYVVIPIAAPTDEERGHPYLWRFWRHMPRRGRFVIYDRSWYGRVLVERVEGFATEDQWRRAYDEISGFERSLADEGMVLVKFWMHVSDAEQRKRFEKREKDPLKQWKLTEEDWRNREKRPQYEEAVQEMLERTDSSAAPWQLVGGDDKRFARVYVIETVIAELERGMRRAGMDIPEPLG
jgi:AMP-polyphosphate phosphotransferase